MLYRRKRFNVRSTNTQQECEKIEFDFNFEFFKLYEKKFFSLKFKYYFVDLDKLILNINIFWGFDKVFHTIR